MRHVDESIVNMTHTILVNGREFVAEDWTETPPNPAATMRRASTRETQSADIVELLPGEISFRCDHTLVVDSILEIKGDGRSYMIIASGRGLHVAKPY